MGEKLKDLFERIGFSLQCDLKMNTTILTRFPGSPLEPCIPTVTHKKSLTVQISIVPSENDSAFSEKASRPLF
jgi:hypothetical protein